MELTLTKADIQAALTVPPKPQGAGMHDCIHFYPSGCWMVSNGSLMIVRRLQAAPADGFSVPVCDLAGFKSEREVTIALNAQSITLSGCSGLSRTLTRPAVTQPDFTRIVSRDNVDVWRAVGAKYLTAIDKIARLYGSRVVLRPNAKGNVNIYFSNPDLFGVVAPLNDPVGKNAVPVEVPDWIPQP